MNKAELESAIQEAAQGTQQKAAEADLRQANRLKDEIVGMISHEFRTPMTMISGNIDVLSRHLERLTFDEREQVLEDLRSHRDRLQRLIENMLVIARVDSGDGPELEPVLLQHVLAGLVKAEQARDETRPVTLSVPSDLPPVTGSIAYIEQVFENLITNARKYGQPGTEIHVWAQRDDAFGRVSVLDHGDKLDPEQAKQFLEPFYQAGSHDDGWSGVGLGLSVCVRLLALMHGAISAQPRPEGGLEVTFSLPLADGDPADQ